MNKKLKKLKTHTLQMKGYKKLTGTSRHIIHLNQNLGRALIDIKKNNR